MVHTAPEPTVGLGCPGLLFSPPSARGGAVHANVCPSRECPAPPSALELELAHTPEKGEWTSASPLGEPSEEASADTAQKLMLRRICQP